MMNLNWIHELKEKVQTDGPVVRVSVIEAKGSTPREVGAAMIVSHAKLAGTIGGGALEFDAIATARTMLGRNNDNKWHRVVQAYPLGPSLGQCCGGFTKLMFEVFTPSTFSSLTGPSVDGPVLVLRPMISGIPFTIIQDRHLRHDDWPLAINRAIQNTMSGAQAPEPQLFVGVDGETRWYLEPVKPTHKKLFLYGAGHVGRAVVRAMEGLPFDIIWVDTNTDRFPTPMPPNATSVPATDPAIIARHAPIDAFHVVMTYSHALDLSICQTVLARGQFQYLGVIGSNTKRERFTRRLRSVNISDSMISRMICPIGLGDLDRKEPAVIAISVAADLLQRLSSTRYVFNTDYLGSTMSS